MVKIKTSENADLSRYSVRFVREGKDRFKPVLYLDGRRVTDPWTLRIAHHEERDENGRSA